MSSAITAYLLLGSNLGDRAALLQTARAHLEATAGEILLTSALYETAAWGREDQPAFLNQALAVRTRLSASQLLDQCLAAERHAGRERHKRWGSRTLDVDILLYGNAIITQPGLTVPHPRLAERRFALAPLAEIGGQLQHPVLRRSVAELLAQCPDPLPVHYLPG
ncbi:2-amino-4-hydroxy-6-hydroxymethyldihydropteridine diphosphokinase [Hymenobacter sp. BT664]|uniref:2-amino-4-hydroxy-6-hydroxymethyldihydropteridine pyrophosphokinase n=1 Tax=Hymenobacter montanus TaxID=2771359 RepID=A0A927BEG8_9BACT|nr:2-amino-4-hydroxy-6-hydroxymethyldihydropteridine diphosphokinase [Hymenobacter montanus]MBD2768901.1 2-amino-4-hydroxy-6-hydroxymethyldihydropteridine diphosphokinase [Hymenobacter montanus]